MNIDIHKSISIIGNEIERSQFSIYSKRRKNHRINLKTNNQIGYLKSGSVSIYRLENDMLTITITAPAIIGVAQMRNLKKSHYIRCNADCELWSINVLNAIDLFNANNLWMHAFDVLSWHLQMYFNRENLLSHPKTRTIIIEHLKHIWEMPVDVREKTSITSFIQNRSHISRSSINKIVKKLTSEKCIKTHRGKLIWMKEEVTL